MAKSIKVTVAQDEQVVEKSVLAASIVEISRSMKRLLESGLNREAVIILTAHTVRSYNGRKPTMSDVRAVLAALAELEKEYCKRG